MIVRDINKNDYDKCLDIYNYYIENTTFTLELECLDLKVFSNRIDCISNKYPYIVCEINNKVVGYAYLSEFSPRGGYAKTASASVYVDKSYKHMGIGTALVKELLNKAFRMKIRDVIAVVTEENTSSIEFHKKIGFKQIGCFEKIAEKFGKRLSVYYFQYKIV